MTPQVSKTLPFTSNGLRELAAVLDGRACFICREEGWCSHREPGVTAAYIELWRKTQGEQRAA